MNAPAAGIVDAVFENLPLTAIAPSETASQVRRRKRYTPESIAEFAANIRAINVMEPVIVRRLAAMRGLAIYELVAGERRWLGAREAELAHIPALIREIPDADLSLFQLSENVQRESIAPLEEAEALRDVMDARKIDAAGAGELIGKSRRHVFNRLKLLALKHPAAIEALESGRLDAGKAVRIAKYPTLKLQQKALDLIGDDAISLRQADEILRDRLLVRLDKVPFSLDDDTMRNEGRTVFDCQIITRNRDGSSVSTPPLPACNACPNCSVNDPELHEQIAAWYGESARACTDKPCHDFKVKLFFQRRLDGAREAGRTIIDGDDAKAIKPWPHAEGLRGYVDLDAPCEEMEAPKDAPDDWEPPSYREVLKERANMDCVAVLVDPHNKQPRDVVPFKEMARALKARSIKLTPHAELPTTPEGQGVAPQAPDQDEVRREREKETARQDLERAFRRKLLGLVHEKWKGPLKRDELQALCDRLMDGGEWPQFFDELHGGDLSPSKMKEPELARLAFELTVGLCVDYLGDSPNLLIAAAKRFKIDPAKVRKQAKAELGGAEEPAEKPAAKKKAKKK